MLPHVFVQCWQLMVTVRSLIDLLGVGPTGYCGGKSPLLWGCLQDIALDPTHLFLTSPKQPFSNINQGILHMFIEPR